jgi:uroporphyrinogen-III synthase
VKNLILMARDKAERLTDDELAEEIEQLESGKRKLRLRDERGRPVLLNGMYLAVFR